MVMHQQRSLSQDIVSKEWGLALSTSEGLPHARNCQSSVTFTPRGLSEASIPEKVKP